MQRPSVTPHFKGKEFILVMSSFSSEFVKRGKSFSDPKALCE